MKTYMDKNEARSLLERMPDNSTWDDLMREIYARKVIEEGIRDSEEGRTKDVKEIRKKYGLTT